MSFLIQCRRSGRRRSRARRTSRRPFVTPGRAASQVRPSRGWQLTRGEALADGLSNSTPNLCRQRPTALASKSRKLLGSRAFAAERYELLCPFQEQLRYTLLRTCKANDDRWIAYPSLRVVLARVDGESAGMRPVLDGGRMSFKIGPP